ncbi:MAG: UDP-2,3-diacylglucosamine diphosphatase [Pseudomonadota bacterium]
MTTVTVKRANTTTLLDNSARSPRATPADAFATPDTAMARSAKAISPKPKHRKKKSKAKANRFGKGVKKTYRSIWISDVHLGTKGCRADMLLDFLKHNESEYMYLVGDIVDGWRLKKSWYWTSDFNDVIRRVLKSAKKGTKVIYVPGNHDEALRKFLNVNLAGVTVTREAIHETADGRKLLVLHGDEFDGVVRYAKWLAFLGDASYHLLLELNHYVNWVRRKLNLSYWSLSAYLKGRVKNAVEYICRFEDAVAQAAKDRGVDGVICGHIHFAEIKPMGDVTYYNDGDWVESCTALVEEHDGTMKILYWADEIKARVAAGNTSDIDEPDDETDVHEEWEETDIPLVAMAMAKLEGGEMKMPEAAE